jgi:hypothetical protein
MSHDLSLAQNHALDLARTLMVPVTLFEINGEIGVYLNSQSVSRAFSTRDRDNFGVVAVTPLLHGFA